VSRTRGPLVVQPEAQLVPPPLDGTWENRRPPYDIVVPVSGRHEMSVLTVASLVEGVRDPSRLVLVGRASDLRAVRKAVPGFTGSILERPRTLPVGQVLSDLLAAGQENDLLIVVPGVQAVPLLDLRLQWGAYSGVRVAAISPLCDVDPLTAVKRFGVDDADAVELDRRLSVSAQVAAEDAPYFLPECCFVRLTLLRAALRGEQPADFLSLLGVLRGRGASFAIAPHVYVGSDALTRRQEPLFDDELSRVFLAESPIHSVARAYFARATAHAVPAVEERSAPRLLHVAHSLGGGLEWWVKLFAAGSEGNQNLVLKSIGERGRFGSQLWLYESPHHPSPIKVWKLPTPIPTTAVGHLAYRNALNEIVQEFGIEAIAVSSLIGHSLDALDTGLPTLFVCHDYYPFCPALHIYFGAVCDTCGQSELAACLRHNRLQYIFDERTPEEWMTLREEFVHLAVARRFSFVAPTSSVVRHYRRLVPEFAEVPFFVVPHGGGASMLQPLASRGSAGRLRVLVLGRLNLIKGAELVRAVLQELADEIEFHLVGCGEDWRQLAGPGVNVVPSYERAELPALLQRIGPDLALLLSIVPETFSFTLEECLVAAIPPVASRRGGFQDRIEDGVTGFLVEPVVDDVVHCLRALAAKPEQLDVVRDTLTRRLSRSATQMVEDYARILDLPRFSDTAYFSRFHLSGPPEKGGFFIPPVSPLGFLDFLKQVEQGIDYHIRTTPQLGGWRIRVARGSARLMFRGIRWAARQFARSASAANR